MLWTNDELILYTLFTVAFCNLAVAISVLLVAVKVSKAMGRLDVLAEYLQGDSNTEGRVMSPTRTVPLPATIRPWFFLHVYPTAP
jgi:hypothetical protein